MWDSFITGDSEKLLLKPLPPHSMVFGKNNITFHSYQSFFVFKKHK